MKGTRRTPWLAIVAIAVGLFALLLFALLRHDHPPPAPLPPATASPGTPASPPAPPPAPAGTTERAAPALAPAAPSATAGWIRGRILDAASRAPIQGAELRLANTAAAPAPTAAARTGADGRFHLAAIVRGKAWLEVRAAGRDARTLHVAGAGPRLDLGDVLLSTSTVATLRVVDAAGRPIPDASVFWRKTHATIVVDGSATDVGAGASFRWEQPTATTDANGCVLLPGATFGTHRLLVVREGHRCHLREVPIREDSLRDLGTVALEAAPGLEIALAREDGGDVGTATIQQDLSAVDSLTFEARSTRVRLPAPPAGSPLRVAAWANRVDGTFWGQLEPDAAVLLLRCKVPAATVRWQGDATAHEPMSIWCFALERGVLWEQAAAVCSGRDGSWHCWPRRGREVRFLAWSQQLGLGSADAAVPAQGTSPRNTLPPLLGWRQLPRRTLRILASARTPAVDAVVVGDAELTEALVGASIGGAQRPRVAFARTSDARGIVDLGPLGGTRIAATVTAAGHAPIEVRLEPDAPEETLVQLERGGEIVVRIAAPPALHHGLRIAVRPQARPVRWFPVDRAEMRLADVEVGPASVVLHAASEIAPALDPPMLDVRTAGFPDATTELDRVDLVVGEAPVWADLSVARGPAPDLTIVSPRALRVAVTPIGTRSLPRQRAFVGARSTSVSRVCGLHASTWLVELLDDELRTVWWREVEVAGTSLDLRANLPVVLAALDGGPVAAQGTLSAQLRDGRTIPWLAVSLRIASGQTADAVPEGRYRGELRTPDGVWSGVVRIEGPRADFTQAPR